MMVALKILAFFVLASVTGAFLYGVFIAIFLGGARLPGSTSIYALGFSSVATWFYAKSQKRWTPILAMVAFIVLMSVLVVAVAFLSQEG